MIGPRDEQPNAVNGIEIDLNGDIEPFGMYKNES